MEVASPRRLSLRPARRKRDYFVFRTCRLASVRCMDGMLREELLQDQLRLLQVIFEPFDQDRGWPVWQYVDLTLDAKFGLDAAVVLDSLPVAGHRSPMSMSYGLTWREDSNMQPQPGTHIALTVAGLRCLRPAT